MSDKLQKVIQLVQNSNLDQTIKDILVRDLQTEGLENNAFLKEQIKAYCLSEITKIDAEIEAVKQILDEPESKPSNS